MLTKKQTKAEAFSELDLFGQYIKCCILEDIIEDIKKTRLNSAKLNEIAIILQAMGMKNEYKQLIGEFSGNKDG